VKLISRVLTAVGGAAVMAGAGSGVADAQIPPPEPTLNVAAVSVGTTTFAAVVNAPPDHVCKSEPAGPPVGPADDYGQAIVNDAGIAAFTIGAPSVDQVRITCGPQFSEFVRTGVAPVFGSS